MSEPDASYLELMAQATNDRPLTEGEREHAAAMFARIPPYVRADLDNPHWTDAREHDWRHHVPDVVRAAWHDLGFLGRVAVYLMAQDAADRWMDAWGDGLDSDR